MANSYTLISKQMVKACNDIFRLREWRTSIKNDIEGINIAIMDYNHKLLDGGDQKKGRCDKWIRKTKKKRSCKRDILGRIRNRIKVLSNKNNISEHRSELYTVIMSYLKNNHPNILDECLSQINNKLKIKENEKT